MDAEMKPNNVAPAMYRILISISKKEHIKESDLVEVMLDDTITNNTKAFIAVCYIGENSQIC